MKIVAESKSGFEHGDSDKPHVIVYGAGECLRKHYKFLYEKYFIEAIVDRNKCGQFGDVPIHGLEYLNSKTTQKIIIMIENRDVCMNVVKTLESEYGILRNSTIHKANKR